MLDKNFLTSFLRLNNASENMSDAEVRETLEQAGWTKSETDAAISLLRSGAGSAGITQVDAATFKPDMEFNSHQLSSLLGVDVEIHPHALHDANHAHAMTLSVRDVFMKAAIASSVIILSLSIAAGFGFCFLYFLEIGPFKP